MLPLADRRVILLSSVVLLGVSLLVNVEGLPEVASNHSLKSFNFQNAHFNARNLWLTFNVLMNGGQLTEDAGSHHLLCLGNLTFATTCRPIQEGCHSNEVQTPPSGVFATLDLCLNANRTISVINLLATYDDATAAIFEQGFVFKSTLTQMEYEQVLVMLANEGIQKAWLGLKLFVSNRRRRDTEPQFVDLFGNMVNSSAIQWAANEPNTTVGECVIIASLGVAMQHCDEPVDGVVVNEFYVGEMPTLAPTTTNQPTTTAAGTTTPAIFCQIPEELTLVVFVASGDANLTANSSALSGTAVQLSCLHQCGILAPAPATSTCGSDGQWTPALPQDPTVCSEPAVTTAGLLCARLFEAVQFNGSYVDIFDGRQACWNVESDLLGSLEDATQSAKVRQGCTLVVYENADASGANASFTTSLADLGSMKDKISTASCNCQALNDTCSIPTAYTKYRYFFNGNEMLFGGVAVPGDTLSFDCTGDCDGIMHSYNESTCQTGGTWSPPLPPYCNIPSNYSGVVRFNGSDGQFYFANDPVAINQSVVISCDRQCDVPVLLTCQADGKWSPAPPAEGDVCRDPDVLISGLFCAALYFWDNFVNQRAVIFSGQRACANVQSYLVQQNINNDAWSISVRENCQLVAYDYADRTGATLSLTSSLGFLGSFRGLTSTVSCVCPPNYCILDDDNPKFKYVVNGMDPWATPYLRFGGAFPPGTNVTIHCRCKIFPTVYVCQSDGTWSPSLPASNVDPCVDPPVTIAAPTCAQVFADRYFSSTTVTMSQEQCFDLTAHGLDNGVSSVYVRRNCVMTGHHQNPNFGQSIALGEDTRNLVGTGWDDRFTVASCSCPPSPPNCLIEPHPNLRYQYNNTHIILGGVIFPGENVTIGCPLPCDDPGVLSTAVYTCQEGGSWSPPLPDASVNTCTSPGNVTSAPLCARLHSEAGYGGNATGIYQQACSNLVGFNNQASSVRVVLNCQLTAYDLSPTYGDSVVISSDIAQLSTQWDKRISSAACSCPASPPNCIVDEHPNIIYSYQGSDIAVGAVLPPGSVIGLLCRFVCAHEALPYSASQCRSDGTWSNPLPASNSDICKPFDIVTTGPTCAVLYVNNYYLGSNATVYDGQQACSNTENFLSSRGLNNAVSSIHVKRNCVFTGYDLNNAESTSFELAESTQLGFLWNNRMSRFSCECPASPPYCFVDDNHPTLRFVYEGSVIVFGGLIPPGGNVTLQCRLPCSNISSLASFVSTCQSDGTWLPELPGPSNYTDFCIEAEPPVLSGTIVCATMFADRRFMGTAVALFDGQSACSNVQSTIGGLNDAASSIQVRTNCEFTGYDVSDASGRTLKLKESVRILLPNDDEIISTASCFCPASSCFIDDYHPTLRFAAVNDGTVVGPAGAAFLTGTNITVRCKAPCSTLVDIVGLTFTCQADRSWSPSLPDATSYTDKCILEPETPTSNVVCARFYSQINYLGDTMPVYQQACLNLASLDNAATSVRVSINCQLTAYDLDPTYGDSVVINTQQLSVEWDNRISSAACSCPASPPNCIVEEHPNIIYSYQDSDIAIAAYLSPGSVVRLRCRFLCAQVELPYVASLCRSDGMWSNPLPASNSNICKPFDIVTTGPECAVLYVSNYYAGTKAAVFDGQQACSNTENFLSNRGINNAVSSIHVRRNCLFTGYDLNNAESRSFQLTESAQLDSYWDNRMSRFSCECPASPPNCLIEDDHPTLRFVFEGSVIVFGGVIPPGGNVTLQCRLPCSNISSLASFVSTCQPDGTWLPELPNSSKYTDVCTEAEPPVLTPTNVCATLYADSSFTGTSVPIYNGQSACINVQSMIGGLNNAATSIRVRRNCVFTGYDLPDATGRTLQLTESVNLLMPTFDNIISTASCFCPASSCFLDDYHPTLRFAAVDDGITVGPAGAAFSPGTNITVRCKASCASLGDIEGLTFNCQADGSWSPSLPSITTYTDKCLVEPEPLNSGTVCATVFSHNVYEGTSWPIYDGQMACTTFSALLTTSSLNNAITSVHVRHGCILTAYDMADATDTVSLTLTSSTGQLDYFWDDRISTLSCTCPDIASRCVIEAHPVFRYVIDGVVVQWGASVAVGSNVTLTCRSPCALIGEWSTFSTTCQAGGTLSDPLPASTVTACTNFSAPSTSGRVCAVMNYLTYYSTDTIAFIYNGQQACVLTYLNNYALSIRVNPGCIVVGYDYADLTGPSIQLTESEPVLTAYRPAPFYTAWGNRISAATCQCQNCYVPASPLISSIIQEDIPLYAGEYLAQGNNATVQCNGLCATSGGSTTCPLNANGNWNPDPLAICQEPAVLQSGQICARLFEQFDYAGSHVDFFAGQQPCMNVRWDLLGSLNDNTKSVRVRYGCTLTVFENVDGTGASRNFTSNFGSLTDFNSLISTASCDCPTGSFCEVASNTMVPLRDPGGNALVMGGFFAAGEVITYQCQSTAEIEFTCTVTGWTPALPNELNPEGSCSGF